MRNCFYSQFVGFLDHSEIYRAIAASAAAIKRSFSLKCDAYHANLNLSSAFDAAYRRHPKSWTRRGCGVYPGQEADPDQGTWLVIEQANIRACLKRRYLPFGTISTFQSARMALLSHRFRCTVVLLGTLLLWVVFWVELLIPLSSVGWCCSAPTEKEKWKNTL